jgi:2-polyprenyl-3-methyl-5-hydroxy-6-metoxy-1,4-benzoquinol methylase
MEQERNYDEESRDLTERKYAYEFDYVHRDFMIRQLSPIFPKGKALEMGCYKGEFTQKLFPFYDDITVIEASESLVEQCREKFSKQVTYINERFEEVSLKEQYDAIFLVHTLEHLDQPELVLKQINRWLTKSGKLFLVVPNANAASRQIAVKMGLISHNTAVTEGERQHGHRFTYTLDSLYRAASCSGLRVIQQGGIFFKPFANFQFDELMKQGIINRQYLEGCYQLGMIYPDLCASIFLVCEKGFVDE